ncbi:cytochrome P450 3A24-like [Liolophura sinensis]|uniref:cytochrome P450 3A24-like n=1 Tax=Liolophura sinensis TaxID=3198878 RepID=UPI003157F9D9
MNVLGLINVPIWVVVLMTVLFLFYWYATRNNGIFKKIHVDGPTPWPVDGKRPRSADKGIQRNLRRLVQKYGRVFGHFEGSLPLLVVGDADMLREITVKEFSSFTNRRSFGILEVAEQPLTDFLTLMENDDWRHNRNSLTPTFSGGKLKKMTGLIVDAGQTFVNTLKKKADTGEPVDMKQHTGAYTMDVIAATAFGIKLDTQTTPNDPFIKHASKFFEFSVLNLGFMILFFFPFLKPLIKGKVPDYEGIGKLSYLDKVIQEGLRINPPLARMDRICNRDCTVRGVHIPAGMGVALPIYMIHHDPGYWPDPEVFDPERFSPENKEKHHPLQWIPFGYGPRNCIGMRLALFEMKVITVQLLQKYRFVPNGKTKPLKFGNNQVLSSTKSGVWVTAVHREKRQ